MKKVLCIFLAVFIIYSNLNAVQKIDDLSFTNTEITQVLKVVSEVFGITIVPDKDVTGNVTRYFKDTNLQETLTLLLEPLGFMYEIKDNIYFVKKKPQYKIEYDDVNKTFNVDANNVSLSEIIDKLSQTSKETIVFEGDANDKATIHIYSKGLMETLALLTGSLNYQIRNEKGIYYAKKKADENFFDGNKDLSKRIMITGTEDKINIKFANQSSKDVVLAMFGKFQKELSLLSNNSVVIPYLDLQNIGYDSLLDIILTFANQSYTKDEKRYFIYNSQSQNQTGKYTIAENYKLKNISSKNVQNIIPQNQIPPSSYKVDNESNLVTFFGSPTEVAGYLEIVKKIDEGRADYQIRTIKLKYLAVKDIKKYLPSKYQNLELISIEDNNSFCVTMPTDDFNDLVKYLESVDLPTKEYKYKFKYLKVDDVVKSMIPTYVNKNQMIVGTNDSSIIFTVTEETKEKLFKYFDSIDVPMPIIRYQLLIVEYIHSNTFKFNWGVKLGYNPSITSFGMGGSAFYDSSDLISANFDIPTIFGYYFSAQLEYKLLESKAKIQMSTEVYGLSGETVNMTNTKTIQYKSEAKDSDGYVREVITPTTFGLTIEMKGRATSSNEVFIEVSAKISDQIVNTSSSSTSQPVNTSEKTVKNSVRTKTGRPLVLGGLTSRSENTSNNKLPGLGDIPIVGNLFKTHNDSFSDSEFIIYVIPFIQKTEDEIKKERNDYIKEIYENHCKDIVDASKN
jgi:general secretion pathway protein D